MKPILKHSPSEVFSGVDEFLIQCSGAEISKLTNCVFFEEDGNGLGMIDIGWLSFEGHSIRVIYYKDGDDVGCGFTFPKGIENKRLLIEKFLEKLTLSSYWISPNLN